jgi:hypothetical protein
MKYGDKITVNGVEMVVKGYNTDAQGRLRGIETVRNEPEPTRWWFDRDRKAVTDDAGRLPFAMDVEVTPEYAAYLRKNPGDGWELRMVKRDDQFVAYYGGGIDFADHDAEDCGPHDRGYRWCKAKPAAGWREYPVEARNGVWMVMDYHGGALTLHKAMSRVGYGGVRWRKPDGTRTATGCMWSRTFVDGRPWKPVAVRFWEGGDA